MAVANVKAETQHLEDQIAIPEGSLQDEKYLKVLFALSAQTAEDSAADTQDMYHALTDKLKERQRSPLSGRKLLAENHHSTASIPVFSFQAQEKQTLANAGRAGYADQTFHMVIHGLGRCALPTR